MKTTQDANPYGELSEEDIRDVWRQLDPWRAESRSREVRNGFRDARKKDDATQREQSDGDCSPPRGNDRYNGIFLGSEEWDEEELQLQIMRDEERIERIRQADMEYWADVSRISESALEAEGLQGMRDRKTEIDKDKDRDR